MQNTLALDFFVLLYFLPIIEVRIAATYEYNNVLLLQWYAVPGRGIASHLLRMQKGNMKDD